VKVIISLGKLNATSGVCALFVKIERSLTCESPHQFALG
jgi:hypothetical protein